jgi:uncharacterized membrane protein
MTWLQRFRLRHYFVNSIWIEPLLSMMAALAAVPLLQQVEGAFQWGAVINPDAARALLGTMASAMFSFIVFVSSALLVAVQLASAQLTPRIIAIVFRDPRTKFALALFVFTFTFTLDVLVRIDASVPPLTSRLAAYGCLANLGVFLYLIDHVCRTLRPSGALHLVALMGRDVIESVYPMRLVEVHHALREPPATLEGNLNATVTALTDGVILAVDVQGLVAMAQRNNCVIEMIPKVGDFVATGDPLFRVFGSQASLSADTLRQSIAMGQERTMEQDPAFAFRIIVDIASKGLSPAINDPTTAVLAIDQIHHLLRNVGSRYLDDERVRDAAGRVRLVYRTPAWDDFVQLAATEIRHFGGESIQVARRLRAMLENLIQTLPEERVPVLRQELALLRRSAERFFPEPEDRALAEVSDMQGVGSKSGQQESAGDDVSRKDLR